MIANFEVKDRIYAHRNVREAAKPRDEARGSPYGILVHDFR